MNKIGELKVIDDLFVNNNTKEYSNQHLFAF